jgi:interleukin-1 receptor-associated kinase 1
MIGEMPVGSVSRETKLVDTNTYKEETNSKTETRTNDMIEKIKENQQNKERFHMEEKEIEKKAVDNQPKIIQDTKQMQDSCDDKGFWNENEDKTILENISKSSLCSICKSRRPNNESQRKFTYEELQAATEGFSIKYSLSEGEYGPAFKGQLDNKLKIAIKKIQVTSLQEQKEFMSEVQLLINTRHENMIMLLGTCIRQNQLLVVYEYACNGSLDQYLSSKDKSMNVKL